MPQDGSSTTLPRTPPRRREEPGVHELWLLRTPDGGGQSQLLELPAAGDVLALGREVSRGVRIADRRLSRLHARIVWDGVQRGFRIGDAGSLNGVFVNGKPVKSQLLGPGDVIRVGDSLLVYSTRRGALNLEEQIDRIAPSELPVLLYGETGAGKEVAARRLHERSGRSGAFVAINCATLGRDLIGSELFGHRRGAFSGAVSDRSGLFVTAENGTLFLDEIADLPLELQPSLLRALEEGCVRPVGGDRWVTVNARVLAATHADLPQRVRAGNFREDLEARLAQLTLTVPPLRERREEILRLAALFASERGFSLRASADATEALLLWSYPKNVRELRSLIGRFAVMQDGNDELDLAFLEGANPEIVTRGSFLFDDEPPEAAPAAELAAVLRKRLEEHGGNVSAVAKGLGKPRAQVYRWLKAFGMSAEDYRSSEQSPDADFETG